MNKEKFLDILKEFFKATVLAKAGEWNQWVGTFALSFIKRGITAWLEGKEEALKALGVITPSGCVDIDMLEEALEEAFNAQPSVKVDFEEMVPFLPLVSTFTKSDADRLMVMLREANKAQAQ